MSDAHHYFMARAVRATLKARKLAARPGEEKAARRGARVSFIGEGSGLRVQLSSHG
jgi:hypothetical protein